MVSIRSSAPTMSAPAACASSAFGPRAKTATRTVLPVPFGRPTTPRTIWSACRVSTPRFIAISSVSSNFAFAFALISATACSTVTSSTPATASRTARVRFPSFAILLHLDAHGLCRAYDDFHCVFNGIRIEVLHLRFGDFAHLLCRDGGDGLAARRFGAARTVPLADRFHAGGFLQVIRGRRRLDVHGEGFVLVIDNLGRARRALLHLLRLGIERLAEFHDVDTALAQRRAHGRARVGLTCRDLQLHLASKFLGHLASPFPTAAPRVSRPTLLCGLGRDTRAACLPHETPRIRQRAALKSGDRIWQAPRGA